MDYRIRPARRSEAKPLIGLYSESGHGKTCSALLLAKGFVGDMTKVVMIETESGRGEVFADDPLIGGYQVIPLRDQFSPKNYGGAIDAANKAGCSALIIDSASHEWEGVGGVLDMAAKNEEAGKKGQLIWQVPKIDHQREFMLRLMQTPIPLVIVCMRAKYPMEQVTKDGKKEWQRSKVLAPKQSDDILFEMMVHAWIDGGHNLRITKPKPSENYGVIMRGIFEEGKPISVETGRRLLEWTKGVGKPTQGAGEKAKETTSPSSATEGPRVQLQNKLIAAGIVLKSFLEYMVDVGWIAVPEGDAQPSLNELPDENVAKLLKDGNFRQMEAGLNKWLKGE
ncbi:MAG: ATP-binding protein [Dehalococcoidia bacterium]|jgi:hypothetical protein|nr:ATP-binding protein [Dehalococcoidia bacterium]